MVINHHHLIRVEFHACVVCIYLGNNFSPMGNCYCQNLNKAKHFVTFDVGKNKQILASSIISFSNKLLIKEELHRYCPILRAV